MDKGSCVASVQSYPISALHRQEYAAWQELFLSQPGEVHDCLISQGKQLAWAIIEMPPRFCFWLPDRMFCGEEYQIQIVPDKYRKQQLGSHFSRLVRMDLRTVIPQRLAELEESSVPAVSIAAGLLRFAAVMHLVHHVIQPWWSATYLANSGQAQAVWAWEGVTPEVLNRGSGKDLSGQDQVMDADRSSFILAGSYKPPFDGQHRIANQEDCATGLAEAADQAAALQETLQSYLAILNLAAILAPYIVADEEYQQKSFLVTGQLVAQGRALACYQTGEMIHQLRQLAGDNHLNSGLSIDLPYFDDHALETRYRHIQVIPGSRTLFTPAFVIRAVWLERNKVMQDPTLSSSTRQHLLDEIKTLEDAFDTWQTADRVLAK